MNLKYYLRGLGIGVVVTALIMGIAGSGRRESLSNEEIKQRASELGMVEESTILADAVKSPETAENEQAQENTTKAAAVEDPVEPGDEEQTRETAQDVPESWQESVEAAATPSPAKEPEATAKPSPARESEATAKPLPAGEQEADQEQAGAMVAIEISSGDGSYTVCEKLEQAGLIRSAASFDTYLCQNGYDRKLRAGSHEIPAQADEEEIARILSGME